MCELVDEDKVARKDGIIALQIHAGPPMKVQFRNVRFKELKHDNPMKADAKKKIVFLAGSPSHGYAQHEHHAGCLLLAKCIQENVPEAETVVYQGWPKDPHALDDAATVVMFCDGGDGHLVMNHLDEFDKLARKGVGLACIHYAVEIPKGKAGDLMKVGSAAISRPSGRSIRIGWPITRSSPTTPWPAASAPSRSTTSGTITCVFRTT